MTTLFSRTTALLIFAATCFTPPAHSTTLSRMSLVQLAAAADTIVRVRCVSAASAWDNGTIWTFTEFDVVERLKGAPASRIRVRVPGGHAGNLTATIEAAPRFQPHEEIVLFLEKTAAGDYAVTAWAAGTFRIRRLPGSDRTAVTQDSSRFAVFDQATKRFHTEGLRDLPLNEFRLRVAGALAQPGLPRPPASQVSR